MTMSRPTLIFLAAAGSAALLIGAFLFQHVGGLAPCPMCLWQRWPHAVAMVIGLLAVMLPGRALPLLGMVTMLVSAGLGLFHLGVERDWWDGPASCTGGGGGLGGLAGSDLLATDAPTGLVMCDEVAWEMLGLSMPGWNAVISLGLALIWAWAARNRV